jgi:Signal transduction histidine kinase involved in nitrogen fixation and metabolism regulation
MDADVRSDLQRGLEIIEARSASLHRFLEAYRRLAQMPAPVLREVALGPLIARAAGLETRINVCVRGGPEVVFQADPDQLEQMLINLVRNAVDAVLEASTAAESDKSKAADSCDGKKVSVGWDVDAREVTLAIEDDGPGLLNPSNVFTPFYTTKPHGSGVGLVLSRQIAEAHGGSIEISNRTAGRGCVVKVVLPRAPSRPPSVQL